MAKGRCGPQAPPALRGFESMGRYWDGQLKSWVATVVAGTFYVTNHDETLATVLGSCVAVCVRAPERGLAGMNHFMLPHRDHRRADTAAMTYGAYSVERLINEMVKYGARRSDLEIKVFGGGNVISANTRIGDLNIEFIRSYLSTEGLPIVAEDVGGPWGRRLRYRSGTGRARVLRLESLETRRVSAEERALARTLESEAHKRTDVELF